MLSLSTQHTQNNSRPVSEQGESNPITSNKATQIVCKKQHLPPVPISNRRQSYANSVFYKKKIHPIIFYRLAVITRITLPVYWKGTEKWHSTSHQCWQYFTVMMGTENFPVAYYLPVGGPVGKLSGRALQGTNRNRRSWPSCTSRHEISGAPLWRELWRNKVRCKGIPLGKVTSRSDTAASSPSLQEGVSGTWA